METVLNINQFGIKNPFDFFNTYTHLNFEIRKNDAQNTIYYFISVKLNL